MRAFARPLPLTSLSLEARILFTVFLGFVLFGLASSAWLAHDDGMAGPASVDAYYRGTDVGAAAGDASGGPAIAVPGADPALAQPPKSTRQLVETFHFHIFIIPVVLLIVGHLFMMCAWSTRAKSGVLVVASLSTLLHIVGPLVVGAGVPGAATVFVGSAILMTVSWLVMACVPLFGMWRPSKPVAAAPG